MTGRRRMRGLAQLAALQRVVLDERRQEFGQRCRDAGQAETARDDARASHDAAAGRLDAVFAAPRLGLDDVTIAALQFQLAEAALDQARSRVSETRQAEHLARGEFAESEYHQRLLGRMARDMRRKTIEKTGAAAIAEAVAIGLSRKERI